MRENTKWIMLVTALAFVGLMVFEWGMDLSGRSGAQASGGEIGRIDGDPVTYQEFLAVYRSLYDRQQTLQEEPIGTAQNRQIEQAAWDQLVMDRLVRSEVERRGLDATEAEIRQAARLVPPPEFYGNAMFQTDGQFDLRKYQQFLASPAVDNTLLLQLEAYYRAMIPRNKLYQQVTAGAYIPDGELWRIWKDQNETVRVRYLALDPLALVPDEEVAVSDEEIATFYNENRENLEHAARASIRLVALDRAATEADADAARQRAIEIRDEILAGADFADVARRESADPASAAQGGDLGTFPKGRMVPAFEEAVWSLPIGGISEPVRTSVGYHLIQVSDRNGDEAAARHILIPIEPSAERVDSLLARADSLETLGEAMTLTESAQRLDLEVRTADIDPDFPLVAGIGRIDEGADWAFNEAVPGDVSPVFEAPGAFYMIELVERSPAGTYSLEEATPQVRSALIVRKKTEKTRQTGREIVDRLSGSSLEEAAAASGFELREAGPFTRVAFVPGLGRANAAIGTAFGLAEGQTSGLVEADGVFYIIQAIEHTAVDREAFEAQRASLRERLAAGIAQERWNRFLAALREEADVVDNRDAVLNPQV